MLKMIERLRKKMEYFCCISGKTNIIFVFYIFSLLFPFGLLSATTSEICLQPSDSSSCTCQACGYMTTPESNKMCVKGDIICIPANYSKFELPNSELGNATQVSYYIYTSNG